MTAFELFLDADLWVPVLLVTVPSGLIWLAFLALDVIRRPEKDPPKATKRPERKRNGTD